MKKRSVSFLLIAQLFFASCMGGGYSRDISITPSATVIRTDNYKILGKSEGRSSVFFLFNLFPVTNPLNIEYALSQAVQKIPGGQSMVNIKIWHETQYYFPLGRVHIVNVEGDVVSFETSPIQEILPDKKDPTKKQKLPDGGIKVGNEKPPAGGITVGGK
ncbi:MAG: hypothetical protein L6Q54_06065 [Leptospiraceae bacterium]|nr:hypothetical protein [Leptospiraceae bacterium]MCK6380801.1 hypothetical protein [Leptospiraceae bacterium]NUM42158.1 hypothetical protein [Leptospiraceae bacterium]